MNKKTAIVSVLLGIFLIGIASAGLLDYFGIITGEVTVEGPTFYANSQEIDLFGGVKELSINTFITSTAYYNITGGGSKIFWTEEFDEPLDFYKPELKLYTRAKIVEDGEIPKGIDLIFGYYQGDDTYEICRGTILVDSYALKPYDTMCDNYQEQNLPIKDIDGFYYEIKGKATPNVNTMISLTNQETKAQVIGVAQ